MGPAGSPVHYELTTGFLKVDHEICPPATLRERTAQHQRLMALRQQGTEVWGIALTFWTSTVGLYYNESVLKDFFNVCLDDPLPQLPQWATPDHSETFRRDFPTSPGPLSPSKKRRLRRKRNTNSTLSLRSGSSKSPLLNPLRSGSSKSPLLSPLRSGARGVRSWARSVPGARGARSWARFVPGARGARFWARSVPGARGALSWARSVPGARGSRSWARSVPGARGVRSWARSVPGARGAHSS